MQGINFEMPDGVTIYAMLLLTVLGTGFMIWFLAGLLAERTKTRRGHSVAELEANRPYAKKPGPTPVVSFDLITIMTRGASRLRKL